MLFSFLYCYGTWNNGFVSHGRCGHCKKLAPEYEKLGASFKKAKSILIGKVSFLNPYYYFVILLYLWMYNSWLIFLVAKWMGLFNCIITNCFSFGPPNWSQILSFLILYQIMSFFQYVATVMADGDRLIFYLTSLMVSGVGWLWYTQERML